MRWWGGGKPPLGGMNYTTMLGYQKVRRTTSLVSDWVFAASFVWNSYPLMSPHMTFRVLLALDTAAS
jgi:hypothetical protein